MTRVRLFPMLPPMILTVASLLLAAFWGMSVFAGWGLEAFCGPSAGRLAGSLERSLATSRDCPDRLDTVSTLSAVFAVIAGGCTLIAWLTRRPVLLSVAVVAWLVAIGVVFVGGVIVQ